MPLQAEIIHVYFNKSGPGAHSYKMLGRHFVLITLRVI